MHIGLIGGIGVAATVAYYQRLTAACDTAPELTIVHADANTLVHNNANDERQAQAEVYAALIDRLNAAGAACAAITSLGGHFCYDETVSVSSLPLVSAVTPLDAYFAKHGFGTVGLMGTRVVMNTRLYGQLSQTAARVPNDIDAVGQAYVDMALSGRCTPSQADYFLHEGQKLIDQGADAVVLAGTDLNLAFDQVDAPYPVVDALDVHVSVLADLAMDRSTLSQIGAA